MIFTGKVFVTKTTRILNTFVLRLGRFFGKKNPPWPWRDSLVNSSTTSMAASGACPTAASGACPLFPSWPTSHTLCEDPRNPWTTTEGSPEISSVVGVDLEDFFLPWLQPSCSALPTLPTVSMTVGVKFGAEGSAFLSLSPLPGSPCNDPEMGSSRQDHMINPINSTYQDWFKLVHIGPNMSEFVQTCPNWFN